MTGLCENLIVTGRPLSSHQQHSSHQSHARNSRSAALDTDLADPLPTGRTVRNKAAAAAADSPVGAPPASNARNRRAADSLPGPWPGTGWPFAHRADPAHPRLPRPATGGHRPATPPRTPLRRRRSGRSSGRRRGRAAGPGRLPWWARRRPFPRGPAARTPDAGPVPRRSRSPRDAPATDEPRSAAGGTQSAGRHSDFESQLAGAFMVTPLLSQAANGHRAGSTHPKRASPSRAAGITRVSPPGVLRHATAINPDRDTADPHTSRNYVTHQGGELRDQQRSRPGELRDR